MDVGTKIAQLEKAVKDLQRASRLSYASLDDTALEVRDAGGALRGIVGQQGDGTTAVNIVNGGPPPAPATPSAAPALGGVSVGWGGTFANGAVIPMDWARVEVHASPTAAFDPTADTLKATIETAQGGIVYIPSAVPLYVALLARNTSGAASPATAVVGPYAPKPVAGEIGIGEITETLIADGAVTTPKVFANAVTTAKLAAGSVDATAIKADAITGKVITGGQVNGAVVTGGVVQTGTSGTRVRMAPDAGGDASPGLALYSGVTGESVPGRLWSTVLNYSGTVQPAAWLTAPSVDSGSAYLRLVSSAAGKGGRFQVATNTSRDFAYVLGADGGETGASQVETWAQNGTSGPSSVLQVKGTQVYMRSAAIDLVGPLTVTGDLTIAGTSQDRGYTAFQARSSATADSGTEQIALTQTGVVIKNGRAYRLRVRGLAVNKTANTGVRIRIRRTNISGAIWLDTFTITTPNANANYQYNNETIVINDTGADITSTFVMTWVSVAAGNSFLNTGNGIYTTMEILDAGSAADFSTAQSAT